MPARIKPSLTPYEALRPAQPDPMKDISVGCAGLSTTGSASGVAADQRQPDRKLAVRNLRSVVSTTTSLLRFAASMTNRALIPYTVTARFIDCHTIPVSMTQLSCAHCHEHRQSKMVGKHSEVTGCVWDNQACFNCHQIGTDSRPSPLGAVRHKV